MSSDLCAFPAEAVYNFEQFDYRIYFEKKNSFINWVLSMILQRNVTGKNQLFTTTEKSSAI